MSFVRVQHVPDLPGQDVVPLLIDALARGVSHSALNRPRCGSLGTWQSTGHASFLVRRRHGCY